MVEGNTVCFYITHLKLYTKQVLNYMKYKWSFPPQGQTLPHIYWQHSCEFLWEHELRVATTISLFYWHTMKHSYHGAIFSCAPSAKKERDVWSFVWTIWCHLLFLWCRKEAFVLLRPDLVMLLTCGAHNKTFKSSHTSLISYSLTRFYVLYGENSSLCDGKSTAINAAAAMHAGLIIYQRSMKLDNMTNQAKHGRNGLSGSDKLQFITCL